MEVYGKTKIAQIGSLVEAAGSVMSGSAVRLVASGATLKAVSATWAFVF